MKKEDIIQEIKRTAEENGGIALGKMRFFGATGIKESDWYGKFWVRWNDAILEAGYAPNVKNVAYDESFLIEKYISLIRDLGRFPIEAELRMKAREEEAFPTVTTFLTRLGKKGERAQKIMAYCRGLDGYEDILSICEPVAHATRKNEDATNQNDFEHGFVYLMKSGKFYKIGRSNSSARRHYELNIQMPEKLHLVHEIKTDDPAGIEAYWHQRFEEKRKNGEWFNLSGLDVKAFKRRKFM